MDWLADLLNDLLGGFLTWLKAVWDYAKKSVSWFWATVMAAALAAVHYVVDSFNQMIDSATKVITDNVIPALQLPDITGQYYELSNTFFPVTLALLLLGAYLGFIGALTLYRLIKSWIPTLS